MNEKTIFLDRDGVINRKIDDDYVKSWDEFEFLPNAKEALKILTENDFRLIVVTNQRGIARGWMTEVDLHEVHTRMLSELKNYGAEIAGIFHCPHDKDQCDCRKPLTGLFLQAQQKFPAIDFTKAIMVGDSSSDIEAGNALGCRTIFVNDERAIAEFQPPPQAKYLGAETSLYEAVQKIILKLTD